jgi:hypothetical protein
MTHKEKLDKVLHLLYPFRHSGRQFMITQILINGGIEFETKEPIILAKRLDEDGLIKASFTKDGTFVKLTSSGIEYCEQESYSIPNTPVINVFSISNSPNNSIQIGNNNSIIYKDSDMIDAKINELRIKIKSNTEITDAIVREIGEYLDELDEKIINKKKIPQILLTGLLSTAADIGTIYPYVKSLVESLKS